MLEVVGCNLAEVQLVLTDVHLLQPRRGVLGPLLVVHRGDVGICLSEGPCVVHDHVGLARVAQRQCIGWCQAGLADRCRGWLGSSFIAELLWRSIFEQVPRDQRTLKAHQPLEDG
eukprot:scaffold46566_cov35-Phaeocystis_antarctica.AAC.2